MIEVHVGLGMQGDSSKQTGFESETQTTPLGIGVGRTIHVILKTVVVPLKATGQGKLVYDFIVLVFIKDDFAPELIIGICVL